MEKPNVLFLCTHNQARSQMAEAFLKRYGGDHFNVFSAGFEKREIHTYTKRVMKEQGLDLKGHTSKELKEVIGKSQFDIIITVCSKAEELCPTVPGVDAHLFWDIEDPDLFEGSEEEMLGKFREVRDMIEKRIKKWLKGRGVI